MTHWKLTIIVNYWSFKAKLTVKIICIVEEMDFCFYQPIAYHTRHGFLI